MPGQLFARVDIEDLIQHITYDEAPAWPEDAVPMPAPAQVIAQIDMLLAGETSQDVIDALLDHRLDMMAAREWR